LFLRKPFWLEAKTLSVKVNNQIQKLSVNEQGYVSVERTWQNGDIVQLALPMDTRLEQLPDGSNGMLLLMDQLFWLQLPILPI
jgi:DUF1680 family protein